MGRFYGLPQALGAIDLNKKEEREHPDIVVADTHEEIKTKVREKLHTTRRFPLLAKCLGPWFYEWLSKLARLLLRPSPCPQEPNK